MKGFDIVWSCFRALESRAGALSRLCAGHPRELNSTNRPVVAQRCGAGVAPVWSAGHQRLCNFFHLALVMLRWSQAQADKRTRPNLMRFSKRPHFTYDSYIYISLILGC